MDPVPDCRALDEPMPSGPALARTYSGDRDGWDRALEFHRVAEFAAEHPSKGSSAVANAIELPRSRIRLWVDAEGAPDPVRGLRTALDRGWLVERADRDRRVALAVLVTWIAAGGSVATETWAPRFSAQTAAERERLLRTTNRLDVDLRWIDRDDEGKGVEAVPETDASVFGRVLVAAGAPAAPTDALPEWITDGDERIRRAAAACYVETRGQLAGEAELLQIREESKPVERLEAIGELLASVAGVGSWTISGEQVRLDTEATDALLDEISYPL